MPQRTPLPCYFADLYATFAECERAEDLCIAPKANRMRCTVSIDAPDVAEAAAKRREAQELPDSQERDTLIVEFVLLHCCRLRHRQILGDDVTGCAEKIAATYSKSLPAKAPITDGKQLRSRGPIKSESRRTPEYFIPYKSEPSDTIRNGLLEKVPGRFAERGEVYSFTWAPHPRFVKIGFTKHSAADRVGKWRRCHAEAMLSKVVSVEYPEKIERLVHLELAKYRYRINICEVCARGHEEWFERSVDQVSQIMSDWEQLTRKESLYDSSRTLTERWRNRINNFDGDLTARALLDRLDAEDTSKREQLKRAQLWCEEDLRLQESKRGELLGVQSSNSSLHVPPPTARGTPRQADDQHLTVVKQPEPLETRMAVSITAAGRWVKHEDEKPRAVVEQVVLLDLPQTVTLPEDEAYHAGVELATVLRHLQLGIRPEDEQPPAVVERADILKHPQVVTPQINGALNSATDVAADVLVHDLALTYFEDFMLLLAQSESLKQTIALPPVELSSPSPTQPAAYEEFPSPPSQTECKVCLEIDI